MLGEVGFSWTILGDMKDLGGEDSSEEIAKAEEVEGCCSCTACCCQSWKF